LGNSRFDASILEALWNFLMHDEQPKGNEFMTNMPATTHTKRGKILRISFSHDFVDTVHTSLFTEKQVGRSIYCVLIQDSEKKLLTFFVDAREHPFVRLSRENDNVQVAFNSNFKPNSSTQTFYSVNTFEPEEI